MEIPKEPKPKKYGSLIDRWGNRRKFTVEKEIRHYEKENNGKFFVFQKLNIEGWEKPYIRIGYYIIGKKGKMNGKWTWGQYCPFLYEEDLVELLSKAKKEGII